MRIAGTLLLISLAIGGLAGCKSQLESCKRNDQDYVGAREMPPLKAPPGLESPDTRNTLKLPPLNAPERPRGKNEPCLDSPPPFSTPKSADGTAPK